MKTNNMTKDEIKDIQDIIGVPNDGIWGPLSKKACIVYLRGLCPSNPWPSDTTPSLITRFGNYGAKDSPERKAWMKANIINLPVEKYGFKYGGKRVRTIRCHRLVADSLTLVFDEIVREGFGWIFEEYNGCFEIRDQRGSDKPSRHSWAIAIDFLMSTNGFRTKWPQKATMPFKVMCIFAKHGWRSGGACWNLDAMHFDAVKF